MRTIPASLMGLKHPDFHTLHPIAEAISSRMPSGLNDTFAERVMDAVEFVLDPIRTGRTRLSQLDRVEKTFIGLKVEHFIRELLDAPAGIRDLVIAGHDVDVKNTVTEKWSWMIPPETYRTEDPCLLIATDEEQRRASMGLILARPKYLCKPNRDNKRSIRTSAHQHIYWLAKSVHWPRNRWADIDMVRFLELRQIKEGSIRAATFFAENLRKPTHRSVIQSLLFDQHDYMKRLRANQGAKDILKPKRIALLSGTYFNSLLEQLGLNRIGNDEHIAIDVRTRTEATLLKQAKQI